MGEDHVHVVLGEQHGDAALAGDPRREFHQRHSFGGGHAGGRLVHQQEARLVGERHGQLHPLEVAIGQHAAGPRGLARHADALQQRHGWRGVLARDGVPQVEDAAAMAEQGHLTFSSTDMLAKVAVIWKVRPHAEAPDAARRHPVMFALQPHLRARAQLPVQHVEAVDLPAPFGPISASSSPPLPGRTPQPPPHPAEGLVQALTSSVAPRCPDMLIGGAR
jgi:hypothetical protein